MALRRRYIWALWAHLTFVVLVGAAAWLGALPFRVQAIHEQADKVMHFLLVGGVAFWLVGVWRDARVELGSLRLPLAILVPACVAGLEELLQALSSRRSADPLDFLADLAGLVVFWLLGRAVIDPSGDRDAADERAVT